MFIFFRKLINYIAAHGFINTMKKIWSLNKIYLFQNKLINKSAILENKKLIELGKRIEIQNNVIIKTYNNKVKIGDYTQINPFTVIYGGAGVKIDKNVMIAPHCMIASGNHDFEQTDKPIRFAGNITEGPITIEKNVWIGANTTITDGVTIGHDSVVGANSVVISDVEPFSVVAGVPAKLIKYRV